MGRNRDRKEREREEEKEERKSEKVKNITSTQTHFERSRAHCRISFAAVSSTRGSFAGLLPSPSFFRIGAVKLYTSLEISRRRVPSGQTPATFPLGEDMLNGLVEMEK